ncbi:MAG: hypothetical protein C4331_16890 [Meiothermus sp.]
MEVVPTVRPVLPAPLQAAPKWSWSLLAAVGALPEPAKFTLKVVPLKESPAPAEYAAPPPPPVRSSPQTRLPPWSLSTLPSAAVPPTASLARVTAPSARPVPACKASTAALRVEKLAFTSPDLIGVPGVNAVRFTAASTESPEATTNAPMKKYLRLLPCIPSS